MMCSSGCEALPAILGAKPELVIGKKETETAGVKTGDIAVAGDVSGIKNDLRGLGRTMDNLTCRIERLEAAVINIATQTAVIATQTTATARDVKGFVSTSNQGMFSGGGVFAFLSLGLVLLFVGVMSIFYARVRNGKKDSVPKPAAAGKPPPTPAAGAYPAEAPTS